jgi:flagellar motor switch protein FliG
MARKPGEKLPSNIELLDGVTRAAVLLLSLDAETASKVLREMPPESVEDVTRELAGLGRVPEQLMDKVIEEFYNASLAQRVQNEGGLDYARVLLKQSMDPKTADRILGQIQTQVQRTPFSFLQKAEAENLLTFIQDEHPQTIALIICHLPHHKAAEILVGLPMQKQIEVIKRIANMEQTNPEVIREVEKGLESRLASMLTQSMEKAGGIPTVSEILNLADRSTEKAILEGLEADDPDLVEEIRRLMFVFEDVLLVDGKGIQAVMREVDNDELALALKTASEALQEKIFSNMSERAATLIREDMEYMGPVRVSDVETAQQRIVDIVRRLEEAGEIIISGRGGAEELIV